MHADEIVTIASILLAGFACQWIAWRTKLPAIVYLLLAGFIAGPGTGWLNTDALLGDLLIPLVSIAVAIILFEGSLTLKLSEMREHGGVVRKLLGRGVLITWLIAALTAYLLLDWTPGLAALFGAIVTVSGPTVVAPLLRTVRPTPALADILRWEAILVDPLGAILALLTFNVIIATEMSSGIATAAQSVGLIVLAGSFTGIAGGYLFGIAIRQRLVPDFLREYAALAAVVAVFAAAETLHHEGGLLAVTIMGIWLANMRDVELEDVASFKESITVLLVSGLFILLSARVDADSIATIGVAALLVTAVLQVIAGPVRAFACTVGSKLIFKERLFLGWIFPRGIVAAAVSALFALRLEENGFSGAEQLVPVVFVVIVGTVIIQSVTARPLARSLGVDAPAPTGVLIVGSNPLALAYAEALQTAGLRVLLADSNWAGVRSARMLNIPTYYGSAVSSYADNQIDLSGIGILLAMSRQPSLNELACVHFAEDFGRDNVYVIPHKQEARHAKYRVSGERRGRVVFKDEQTIEDLLEKLDSGMEVRTTPLSAEFDFSSYLQQNPGCLPLFAVDENLHVSFPVSDAVFKPAAKSTVTALVAETNHHAQLKSEQPQA